MEAGNKESGEKLLNEGIKSVRKYNGYVGKRVNVRLGPHAAYSFSPELLTKVRE